MTREEMIEEARKAIHAVIPGSGTYDSWLPAKSQGLDFLGDIAEAAFAVFEKAQAPTDDEREVMGRFTFDGAEGIAFWVGDSDEEPVAKVMFSELPYFAEFLSHSLPGLFGPVRRPAQTEPTDAERETLIDVMVMTKLSDYATTDMSAIHQAVDAILAAGFRRPAQTEPSDAYVTALASEFEREWNDRVPEFDPEVHDESGFIWEIMRAALKAAFAAGQEEQS